MPLLEMTLDFSRLTTIYGHLRQRERTLRLGAINRGLRQIGQVITPAVKAATPVRTGKLKRSTVFQIRGQAENQELIVRQSAHTSGGAYYGAFVREGTRAHVIRPVQAKALRFMVGGRVVFAQRVNHPGTRANPYHERALESVRPRILQIVEQVNRDTILRIRNLARYGRL